MPEPILSVVVPCYNQGSYLPELLSCFPDYLKQDTYELIIVNDGSPDPKTRQALEEISAQGYTVLHQENQGVCIARNQGISKARGKYIFTLDGDDLVDVAFLHRAIELLEKHPDYSVVYCDGEYFNARQGPWQVGPFNLQKLMLWNYIPSCAVFRKSVWEKAGGYDPELNGLEDWDLWLGIAFNGGKFYYLNETYFKYRITLTSSSNTITEKRNQELWAAIQKKYSAYIGKSYLSDDVVKRFAKNKRLWLKLFIRVYFPSYFNKLLRSGRIENPNLD